MLSCWQVYVRTQNWRFNQFDFAATCRVYVSAKSISMELFVGVRWNCRCRKRMDPHDGEVRRAYM